MQKDEIIEEYISGQKSVALVINKDYGKCIKKTKNENTSTIRMSREVEIQKNFDFKYYPKIYFSEVNGQNILIYEEYIEGRDLLDYQKEGTVYKNNENKCLNLLKELIIGLKFIWDKNIVHRDLKHNNIRMRTDADPVILDLGLAKILEPGQNITLQMGYTEGYAPIEQILNNINQIDKRTDFFSLGVIIYELFFGERLFSTNDDIINKMPVFTKEGYNNSDKLNNILTRLLEKQIYNRYRKAEDILKDIDDALEKEEKR